MLHYVRRPGTRFKLLIRTCSQLAPDTVVPIRLGCGPFTSNTLGFLVEIAGGEVFPTLISPESVIELTGHRPIDGRQQFDSVYMRWMLYVHIINRLAHEDFKGLYDFTVSKENSVHHVNILGKVEDDPKYREVSENFLSVPPIPYGQIPSNIVCSVDNGVLTDVSWSNIQDVGHHAITAAVGIHDTHIWDKMDSGSFDEGYEETFYFPIWEEGSPLTFIVFVVDRDWNGSYRGRFWGYKLRITPTVNVIPPLLNEGSQSISVSSIFDAQLDVQRSAMFSGLLYSGWSHHASLQECREMLGIRYIEFIDKPWTTTYPIHDVSVHLLALGEMIHSVTAPDAKNFLDAVGYEYRTKMNRLIVGSRHETFASFKSAIDSHLPNLLGGMYLSSVDAVNSYIDGVKSNFIETALEIRSVLQPIDAFKALITFRKGGGQGIKDFLKLLANANLAYKFGVVPTLADADAISKDVPRLLERIRSREFITTEVRGKETVILDDGTLPGITNCFVTVRTKARFTLEADALFSYLLPFEQLGVLPTASRIWNVLSYSWLVDYFVNIGELLDLGDKQFLLLLAKIEYSTNSLMVRRPLDVDAEEYNFKVIDEEVPEYRSYSRIVLPGKLPILGPTTVPLFRTLGSSLQLLKKWDILGSVLVQKLF